jgi:hypothetical protein
MESTRGPYEGDPVEWILSHARSVNFALELITEARLQRAEAELAAEEKKAGINRALDKALVEGRVRALVEKNITIIPFNTVVSNAPDGAKASGHMWPIGTSNEFAQYSAATWADNFEHLIPQMLSNVVNKNTAGVRPQLMYSGEGPNGLQLQFSANALVEVVWYKVGEMAAMAWQRDGAGLRSCKACGRLFIVTDRRQMFCPKNSLPGQQIGSSSCGSRYRQRENRRSK